MGDECDDCGVESVEEGEVVECVGEPGGEDVFGFEGDDAEGDACEGVVDDLGGEGGEGCPEGVGVSGGGCGEEGSCDVVGGESEGGDDEH